MSYDQSQVAFIDTETTGLDPERHKVWEIAVIVDGVEHCWQQRWTPGWHSNPDLRWWIEWCEVDEWVLENTRVRQDFNYATAMWPISSISRFVSLVKGRHLVGACPWFDSERLHRCWLHHGGTPRDLPWHYHLIDVENLAVGWLAGLATETKAATGGRYAGFEASLPWRSTDLSLALGVNPDDFEPKHSALADARWAKAIYEAIMGEPQ